MSCNHCATASTGAAQQAGAPDIEASWAANRQHPQYCPTCHAFLRADGGCSRCEQQRFSKALADARRMLRDGDPEIAAFMVRDLPETKMLGLSDLAWATTEGNPGRADTEFLLDELEAAYEAYNIGLAAQPSGLTTYAEVLGAMQHRCEVARLAPMNSDEATWLRSELYPYGRIRQPELDKFFYYLVEWRVGQRQAQGHSAFAATSPDAIDLVYPSDTDIWAATQLLGGGPKFRLMFCEGVEIPVRPGEKTPPAEVMLMDIGQGHTGEMTFRADVHNAALFNFEEALPVGKITRIERVLPTPVFPAAAKPPRQGLTCGHVLRRSGAAGDEVWCTECDDWSAIGLPAACETKLDFGQHKGRTLQHIEQTEPGYVEWLAENARDPDVRAAAETTITASLTDPENFMLGFGKHQGRKLGDLKTVDPGYIQWLTTTQQPRMIRTRIAARLLLKNKD